MSALSLLRQSQFRRIFLAQAVSTLGDQIAPIAVAFAVLQVTQSATALGLVLAARTLATVLLLLFGGAWADRLPRRSIMVVSDLVRLVTQGIFAVLLTLDAPPLWAMMALQAGNGAASAFFRPASSGLLQEVVDKGMRQQANGLLSATTNISSIAGPILAAGLIAVAGNAWAVGANAISFGVSAIFLIGVTVPARAPKKPARITREIAEGFRVLVATPWIGLMILQFSVFQLLVLAAFSVLGPLLAFEDYGGAATWALVAAISGAGALIGDGISLRIRASRPLLVANLVGLGFIPLFIALAVGAPLPILLAAALLFGVSFSLPDTLWYTALQDNVPGDLIARVSSFDWMGSAALRPLGLAAVAPLAMVLGPTFVLIAAAVITAATSIGVTLHPSVRGLRAALPLEHDSSTNSESPLEPRDN